MADSDSTAPDFSRIRHDKAREALAQAVADLTSSEGWRRWLETRARFHSYSLNNCLLIMMQRPTATYVAGYQAWREMGRQVSKGEKGIAILAPIVITATDEETGDKCRKVVGFRGVHVFDIAQTHVVDEKKAARVEATLPTDFLTLVSDESTAAYELYGRLFDFARRIGFSVESGETGDANGYLVRSERRIMLSLRLGVGARAKTLAHELAHWFDPAAADDWSYRLHRGEHEVVAESAAWIVCRSAGLDTSCYSVGYVASWSQGDASAVYALAHRTDTAANAILAGMGDRQAVDHPEVVAA